MRAALDRGRGFGVAALVTLFAFSLLAPSAANARGLETGFMDSLFGSGSASSRHLWLGKAKAEGAGIIRQNVNWASVTSRKPIAPTNPADPAYHFAALDSAVRSEAGAGMKVLLTVYDAPRWAEGRHRPNSAPGGTWKPSPKALGQFAQALAKRYSGKFLGLPRVRYFQAWNEPNLVQYLTPQWNGKRPASPGIYRNMLNAFYSGVKRSQGSASVVTGGTAPYGDPPGGTRMMPLVFWRKVFCLKGNLKGAKCPHKPHLDILAHHPITDGNPATPALNRDNAGVADFHKITKVLRAAERAHNIQPKGHHGLWATELWWNTKPPNRFGFPPKTQARWIEQAFYLLWKQGASAVINLEIRDSPLSGSASSLQSGVYFHSGKAKPSARTFRFPFVTHRKSKISVGTWGKSPGSGTVQVQRKVKKGWKTVKRVRAKRGQVFQAGVRQRGSATFRAKLGTTTSMAWHQGG